MTGAMAIVLLGVLVYVLYRFFIGSQGSERREIEREINEYETVERSHMPREIAQGRLVASEDYFRTRQPRPLGAQVDQVYLTREGDLVPVETKRRFRKLVTAYDQIELSVQACVLRTARPPALRRYRVADYAYVRITAEGRMPSYLPVKLLSDDELVALYERYWKVFRGKAAPMAADHPAICRKCAYLSRCPNPKEAMQPLADGPAMQIRGRV